MHTTHSLSLALAVPINALPYLLTFPLPEKNFSNKQIFTFAIYFAVLSLTPQKLGYFGAWQDVYIGVSLNSVIDLNSLSCPLFTKKNQDHDRKIYHGKTKDFLFAGKLKGCQILKMA